ADDQSFHGPSLAAVVSTVPNRTQVTWGSGFLSFWIETQVYTASDKLAVRPCGWNQRSTFIRTSSLRLSNYWLPSFRHVRAASAELPGQRSLQECFGEVSCGRRSSAYFICPLCCSYLLPDSALWSSL